ncbi:TIGR04282 family arsenosugar biosynthesis glycosyltransferase [Aestuariivivens marinum]|uniref:TIGR04282 family arsenosugar biosynthesis glycosyltransferase n=1 Tax=Aestuariivivens marinum TaxID=2913555 RepID=UPI001F5AADF0|nr:TIGR04282 family arsenosugar biosynthesis glycosyltransferase [Aestuariivivens marinum]
MTESLLIVFVKNLKLGKVKTRLAKTIGNRAAFEVYNELVNITEQVTQTISIDKHIYFSDVVIEDKWSNEFKNVQVGKDLGERMKNAFKKGFEKGYERIVLIGSDLPDISDKIIEGGINALNEFDVVFGPAKDGGYYLIGLTKMHNFIFENKPWSQQNLLEETLKELCLQNITYSTLLTLNDIDNIDDLLTSNFFKENLKLQEKLKQLND